MSIEPLATALAEARACILCRDHLPLGPRPVLRAEAGARLLIVGQAPGTRVHETGIPWNDPSGDRLRDFLPLPHPSWRNTAWLKRHPWFTEELLPELRRRVTGLS